MLALETAAVQLVAVRARLDRLARARRETSLTPVEREEYDRLGRLELGLLAVLRQRDLAA